MLSLSEEYDFLTNLAINSKIETFIKYEVVQDKVIVRQLNTNIFKQFEYLNEKVIVHFDGENVVLSPLSNEYYNNEAGMIYDANLLDLILQVRKNKNTIELDRKVIKLNLLFACGIIAFEEENYKRMRVYFKKIITMLKKDSELIYDLGW